MNGKDLDYVRDTVENEGFDYAFDGYSDFREVEDEEFHRLRKEFLNARKALREYLNIKD